MYAVVNCCSKKQLRNLMAYRADSEEFEEEEEDEEEEEGGVKVQTESAEEGEVTSLIADGDENARGQNRSEDSESRGSRHSSESFNDGQLSDSVHEDEGAVKNKSGDRDTPVCHSSNSDEVGAGGQDHLSPPRMVSSGEFESDLDYNEEEDDQRKSRLAERRGRKVCGCVCVPDLLLLYTPRPYGQCVLRRRRMANPMCVSLVL